MSERSGCGEYLMRIFIAFGKKKKTFMCFCFVCRNMSQTSENERAEQIWSGWSKFGVGGTNLEWVEQIWSGWSGCGQNSVESS